MGEDVVSSFAAAAATASGSELDGAEDRHGVRTRRHDE